MTYLDRPVFDFRPDFKEVNHGQLDDHTFESQGHGAATPWKVTSGPRRKVTIPFSFGSRAELDELRNFIRERVGRRRGFWLPVWLTDYELVNDVSATDTELVIEKVSVDAAAEMNQFKHLFLADRDKLECYAMNSVTTDGDEETITLASGLATDSKAGRVVIGGLLYVRLQEDEISYEFDGHQFARVTLSFIELPEEYVTAHDGEMPIYLYEFTRGLTTWRYANWGQSIEAGGHTWNPQNITNDDLSFGIEFLGEETALHAGTNDENHPLRFHVDSLQLGVTEVTIYEIDGDNPPAVLPAPIYSGRVGQLTFGNEGAINAQCSSAFRIAEMTTPRPGITRRCIHRLGDDFCQVDLDDFTTTGTITALGNAYVEAADFGTKATAESDPRWFVFGRVTAGDEVRFCTGQNGNRLYLNAPFRNAAVNDAISAIAGCDKLPATCEAKFGNLVRNVSFFYTPSQNPQFKGAQIPAATGGKK